MLFGASVCLCVSVFVLRVFVHGCVFVCLGACGFARACVCMLVVVFACVCVCLCVLACVCVCLRVFECLCVLV